jgi:transcriptional regulator with XRE-family HTH domain
MQLFGEYLRKLREKENLPLRKVAAYLDIESASLKIPDKTSLSNFPKPET